MGMSLRELEPGSPEAKRRDKLLVIMRDPNRPQEERLQAAVEALPLCHTMLEPIVVHTFRPSRATSSSDIRAIASAYTGVALEALEELAEGASREDVRAEAARELAVRSRQIRRTRKTRKGRS
jgi:hypothetical protein